MKVVEKQICLGCGEGSMFGVVHARCKTAWGMDGVVRVLVYKGIVKRMVGKIKYKGVYDLFGEVVEAVVSLGDMTALENDQWLVVGVPLHPRRERERGFNQADMLGEMLAKNLNWEFQSRILRRIRYTKPQVTLNGRERRENVKGVFELANDGIKEKVKGRNVLVVDDVWTTGATMKECGKVLKRTGVAKVWGLTIAS